MLELPTNRIAPGGGGFVLSIRWKAVISGSQADVFDLASAAGDSTGRHAARRRPAPVSFAKTRKPDWDRFDMSARMPRIAIEIKSIFLQRRTAILQCSLMTSLSADEIRRAVQMGLEEDIGSGDATTLATVPVHALARAVLVAREPLVLAGLALAEAAFRELSGDITIVRAAEDGRALKAGDALLRLEGPARLLLSAERVALNFVQRLSGIATLTAQFVEAIQGTRARILDTRKTTPGLRLLEKYAVTCGGGQNHRFGLDDLLLIKDNH